MERSDAWRLATRWNRYGTRLTASSMFGQRILDKKLGALGVRKQTKLTYGLASPNQNLTWTLSFRLLGVYRWEIEGSLRATHAVASAFARRCLAEYAGQWWADAVARLPEIGMGHGFPITNLTNWSQFHSLKIKDFTAEESATRVASDVNQHVLPFVHSIQDDRTYLDRLLADDLPMRWLYCQPLTRFAEAVKLSFLTGRGPGAALQAIERERQFAKGQLRERDLDAYIASVVRAATDAQAFRSL